MDQRWLIPAALLTAALALFLTIRLFYKHNSLPTPSPDISHRDPNLVAPGSQMAELELAPDDSGSHSNILELPQASLDFVGHWGGYTHTEVKSMVPGRLIGSAPDRVSIIFGEAGNTVFIGSELYSPPHQHLLSTPRVRIVNPKEALIEYAARDRSLYYEYIHFFRLLPSAHIAYHANINIYERPNHLLAGTVRQSATLSRLDTFEMQLRFARPSPDQLPQRRLSSSRRFAREDPALPPR